MGYASAARSGPARDLRAEPECGELDVIVTREIRSERPVRAKSGLVRV